MQRMHAVHLTLAFVQGLILSVPEMVPFRLTQNVIDGFGVSGVEGVFRKSAETTLAVLREHRAAMVRSPRHAAIPERAQRLCQPGDWAAAPTCSLENGLRQVAGRACSLRALEGSAHRGAHAQVERDGDLCARPDRRLEQQQQRPAWTGRRLATPRRRTRCTPCRVRPVLHTRCTSRSAVRSAMPASAGRLTGTLLGVKSIPSLPMSVEGQALRLIKEATNKENLGSMCALVACASGSSSRRCSLSLRACSAGTSGGCPGCEAGSSVASLQRWALLRPCAACTRLGVRHTGLLKPWHPIDCWWQSLQGLAQPAQCLR